MSSHNSPMRILCLAILIVFAVVGSRPLSADQTEPRLDNLFLILQTSEKQIEVRVVENLIWSTWIQHDDGAIYRLMQFGIKAMADRRFDDAVEVFTALIDQAPDYAEAWNKRATVYFIQGKLALSSVDVERTLALEPRHFGALSGLGQIEMLRGNGDAALKAFEDVVRVHPRMAGMHALIRDLKQRVRGQEL
jgi:tetratricopeptide (TPR) repeat protein